MLAQVGPLWHVSKQILAIILSKNQTIQNRLDDIISVQDHIANQKAIIGARTNSLDRQKELIAQRTIAIEKDMSGISDADLAALVTELQGQITGLQASQQAFVKISNLNVVLTYLGTFSVLKHKNE